MEGRKEYSGGIGTVLIPFDKKDKHFFNICPVELQGLISREEFSNVIEDLNDMVDSYYPNDCDGLCFLLSCLCCLWPFVCCCIASKKKSFAEKSSGYLATQNRSNPRVRWNVKRNKDKEIECLEIVYFADPIEDSALHHLPSAVPTGFPQFPVIYQSYSQPAYDEGYIKNGDSVPLIQTGPPPYQQVEIAYGIEKN